MQTRFLASQPNFVIKVLTKDGVKIIDHIEKPIPIQCGWYMKYIEKLVKLWLIVKSICAILYW